MMLVEAIRGELLRGPDTFPLVLLTIYRYDAFKFSVEGLNLTPLPY